MTIKIGGWQLDIKESKITEIESEIINYIKEYNKEDYSKIIEKDNRLEIILALSDIRENIINWYPFKENATILEIGADFGQLTGFLCKNSTKVVSLEVLKEKREAIAKRHEEFKNLTIIGNIEDVEEKFDYIIIENLSEDLEECIKSIEKNINDNTVILFMFNNKYALRSFNGLIYVEKNSKEKYSKKMIENTLKKIGIENYKFYYPLPNYKLPNVIFTDEYLPNQESILRDFTLYDEHDILVFDEREKYKEILKENAELFKFFANSYLVEISKGDNKIEFISFGNSRKEKYRIKTVIMDDMVYKQNITEDGKNHIEEIKENIDILKKLNINMLDSYDENKIYSKLIKNQNSFDKVLIKKFAESEEEALKLIDNFFTEIKEKICIDNAKIEKNVFEKYNIDIAPEKNDKLHYTPYGIFDLIFQNCFYIDGKFYFYDQEWREENIPIEFIFFRSINYLANSNRKIDREQLYRKFEIADYVEDFEKLEDILQEKIKDNFMWKMHATNNITIKRVYDTLIHYRNLKAMAEQELDKQKEEERIEIEKREQKIKELTDELNAIKNSRSWKITKPLRDIRNFNKKK